MSITVSAVVEGQINFAASLCGVSPVSSVTVSGDAGKKVILHIYAEPAFIYEYKKEIVLTEGAVTVQKMNIRLDAAFYRQELLEAQDGTVKIEILDGEDAGKVLAFTHHPVHLQPYLQWIWVPHKETLSSFMQPNDPLVAKVLGRAGEMAGEAGGSMVGYQWQESDVIRQAEWIYLALQEEKIHYLCPPASFEQGGQKIRIPHLLLHDEVKQGTCLDLAVLYATCLEAASIHPVIFVVTGHAFSGFWINREHAQPRHCVEDLEEIKAYIEEGELIPVECTTMTDGLAVPFEQAIAAADKHLAEKEFQFSLDVAAGRKGSYLPIFTYTDKPICSVDTSGVDLQPANEEITKLERLRNQAMDVSMRNQLLAKKDEKDALVFSLDSGRLFDGRYSDGDIFLAMKNHEVEGGMRPEALEDVLYELQSADRQMKKNTGCGTLYLAVDQMIWKPKGVSEYQLAPLYLCPAEIFRNVRGEYVFQVREEESILNPVLCACLLQQFGIDLRDCKNFPGSDYAGEHQQIVHRIALQEGWQILENQAELGQFQVPDEAIWRGLGDQNLLQHEIVQGLLAGKMSWENDIAAYDPTADDLDAIYAFPADASQSSILRSVYKKRAQVITGPAGSGKSQTIANLLIEYMRKGRNVLFVTEKQAALKVVYEKLASVGLDLFCLMMPDGKVVAGILKEAVKALLKFLGNHSAGAKVPATYEERYRKVADELRRYADFMTRKGDAGWSMEELLDMFEKYRDLPVNMNVSGLDARINQPEAMDVILAYQEVKKQYPEKKSIYGKYLQPVNADSQVVRQAEQAVQAFQTLSEAAVRLEVLMGLSGGQLDMDAWRRLLTYAQTLLHCPVVGPGLIVGQTDLETSRMLGSITNEMLGSAPGTLRHEKLSENLWKRLGEIAEENSKDHLTEEERFLESRLSGSRQRGGFSMSQMEQMGVQAKYDAFCQEKLMPLLKDRDEEERKAVLMAAETIGRGKGAELTAHAKELLLRYKQYQSIQETAGQAVLRNLDAFAEDCPHTMRSVLFQEWLRLNKEKNQTGSSMRMQVDRKASDLGMEDFLLQMDEKIRSQEMDISMIPAVFEKSRLIWNIETIRKNSPEMAEFSKIQYGICVQQMRENEEKAREQLQQGLVDEVLAFLPDIREGVSDSKELGVLQKLARRKDTQLSVRQIFEEAPEMIRQLFPCIMMGPETAAEYLPSNSREFDLVVFDEASQLPAYKALIPIARGRKTVFIGDEKQLAPTTFFRKQMVDTDGTETPVEAVLEDAVITSMPQKMLRCHYRSDSEELVAFSNHHYYDGEIVTFPDVKVDGHVIHWHYVENGCYDRGDTRCNRVEAEAVLAEIRKIYEELPENTDETVAVITFNIEQMKLLQVMVREAISSGEPCSRQLAELVDVVNLESCQGREWDRTILSMTYGPDAEGNFSTNLGPLTRAGGGNRLNVMITRSRKELYVVTSMKPELFADESGTKDLRDFLSYARGDYSFDTSKSEAAGRKEKNRNLIQAVAEQLEKKGYTVHTNIGSSSCKVDIGVVGKDKESYQLGILLDSYGSSEYPLHDREILIPDMLAQKGWNIYRLHALNWYEDSGKELKQIEKQLVY